LFVIATPIGNLADISLRVEDALTESSVIFAEDTRVSINLLSHLGLSKKLLSCHDFNEANRAESLERYAAEDQTVALISDAGTPLISDPGYQVVKEALRLGMKVIPIPGPSAVLVALVGSGLPCDRFVFEGFLPDKRGERSKRLEALKSEERTVVLFVSPHGIKKVVADCLESLGDRDACLARELTKFYEEFIRGKLSMILGHVQSREVKGEYVLVLGGADADRDNRWTSEQVEERVRDLLAEGGRLKDVSSLVAKSSGWSASDIYKKGLSISRKLKE
jgi:16S rRNA (cytidine1402-2'-O)-methyltransferase